MREIEFLPSWYHQLRRRKRVVILQTWMLVIIVLGLGSWTALAQRNVKISENALGALKGQLDQTNTEKRMLSEQLSLRQELQAREQLIAALGLPVEMTRLIQTLDSVMPEAMSLLDFTCQTEEQVRQTTSIAGTRGGAGVIADKDTYRRLRVKIVGVAPSDMDLANLLAGLTNVPFFEQVGVSYARDRSENGHVLREFEITFSMDLIQPGGN